MTPEREEAARWFIRLRDTQAGDAERQRFERWLASDPAHVREYAELEAFWSRLDDADGWKTVDQGLERQCAQRRQVLKRGLGLALLASIGGEVGWWQWRHAALWEIVRRSDIGQTRRETLDDDSQLTLGAASQVAVIYSRAERHVILHQGEAAFDVQHDSERPFIVEAGLVRITVLGTRFAVNQLADRTRISVDHGRVQVETGPFWRRQHLLLRDGEVAEVRRQSSEVSHLLRVPYHAAGAFSFEKGFIDLQNAGLAEVAATFSRYRKAPVILLGHPPEESRITASVNVADVEGFLRLLPRMAAVNVHVTNQGQVILQQRL